MLNRRKFIKLGSVFLPAAYLARESGALTLEQQAPFFIKQRASSGGGGGGSIWTLIASTSQAGSSGSTVTNAINNTGANLNVIALVYSGGTIPSVSDSAGSNVYTAGTDFSGGNNPRTRFLYCISPTTGSSVTFTAPAASGFSPCIFVWSFAKTSGTPALDTGSQVGQSNGVWTTGSVSAGTITPATANDLILEIVSGAADLGTVSIDSGFAPSSQTPLSNVPFRIAGAYKIKSSDSTAENPNWTKTQPASSSGGLAVGIAFQ